MATETSKGLLLEAPGSVENDIIKAPASPKYARGRGQIFLQMQKGGAFTPDAAFPASRTRSRSLQTPEALLWIQTQGPSFLPVKLLHVNASLHRPVQMAPEGCGCHGDGVIHADHCDIWVSIGNDHTKRWAEMKEKWRLTFISPACRRGGATLAPKLFSSSYNSKVLSLHVTNSLPVFRHRRRFCRNCPSSIKREPASVPALTSPHLTWVWSGLTPSDSRAALTCRATVPFVVDDPSWDVWWTVDGQTLEKLSDQRFSQSNR